MNDIGKKGGTDSPLKIWKISALSFLH